MDSSLDQPTNLARPRERDKTRLTSHLIHSLAQLDNHMVWQRSLVFVVEIDKKSKDGRLLLY
jgi:hypothetical protein